MHLSQSFTLPKTYRGGYHNITAPFQDSHSRGKPAATNTTNSNEVVQRSEEGLKERIRELFKKVEISVSAYDTAWVAMIPSGGHGAGPLFPECLDWLLDNQLQDGSWGLHPFLHKDTLSSTLASILALKRWGVGQHHINKGMNFMDTSFHLAIDKNHHSPIGFDIIFPGMIDYAGHLDLILPLEPTLSDALLLNRDLELKRCWEWEARERDAYLAYVSEGIGKSQDWKMVMKHQRKNGSLFNSPATTAAALTHHLPSDSASLSYIRLLLQKFGNAVPTSYPGEIYVRLCMIENLQKLGIDWHFGDEIQSVLDEIYSCWLEEDEEIYMDISTCAKAFRLLRMNGYKVSSDPIIRTAEENDCFSSNGQHLKCTSDTLELYKASQMIISPDESSLRKCNSKSSHNLKYTLSRNSFCSLDKFAGYIRQEVDDGLKFPFYASLERMENRRNIEQYNVDCSAIRVLKSSYSSSNIGSKDFQRLAIEDFNFIQSMQREELNHIKRWAIEVQLNKLKFARQKEAYCFFSAAATFFVPELSYARLIWAQNSCLATVLDDFFDTAGSPSEFLDLIRLTEKWNIVDIDRDCFSKEVGIIFSAIYNTNTDFANNASICQGRSVSSHIAEIWVDLLKGMWVEAEWGRTKYVPSIEEYMETAYKTSALGPIILPALYVVGEELSEEAIRSSEYNNLLRLVGSSGRVLNDIQSLERETLQGKLNFVSLLMIHDGITKEEAIEEGRNMITRQREELLGLVVNKGGLIPRACKEIFWKMEKVLHLFYGHEDGFSSNNLMKAVEEIIYQPV